MIKSRKKLPVYVIILIDAGLIALFFGLFITFEYFIPKVSSDQGSVVLSSDDIDTTFKLPADSSEKEKAAAKQTDPDESQSSDNNSSNDTSKQSKAATSGSNSKSSKKSRSGASTGSGSRSNENTEILKSNTDQARSTENSNITSKEIKSYKSDNAQITVYEKTLTASSGNVVYYVADCYVTSAAEIKTYLAENTYGTNIKDSIENMDKATGSVLSINGDFYGNSESGVVIRNGKEYRSNNTNADICVLFKDGSMKTYSPSQYNAQEVIKQGAWQAWCFGPTLLDANGNVPESYNTTSFINKTNPRTAIGYIEPGHYIFVVVDGRDADHSVGVTLSELSSIMKYEGCKTAYNLDGGNSSVMTFKGELVNQPSKDGRDISDIVYIA